MVTAMKLALKRLVCCVLIGVLVSAQVAVAAYACPELGQSIASAAAMRAGITSEAAEHVAAGMEDQVPLTRPGLDSNPCGNGLDPVLPNLCLAHCQLGQQSADHQPAPVAGPALLNPLYTIPAWNWAPVDGARRAVSLGSPANAGAPPLAILHCCLRD